MSINATVTAAVADLEAAIEDVGQLQNASQATLAPIAAAVADLLGAIDAQVAGIEAEIDETAVGGMHVGTPVPQMVATLVAQTQAATDLSQLETLRGYASRIGANIVNAPG